MPKKRETISIATARILPILELCLCAFACFVHTHDLAVEYLLHARSRTGTAAAILTVYWVLLTLAIGSFLRSLLQYRLNPPYDCPDASKATEPRSEEDYHWYPKGVSVYICEQDGLPRRCGVCSTFKSDRAHHAGDIGRCIQRYDHYCPWFAGSIGKTNHKFFIQFLFYTFLWCLYSVIVLAIFINEQRVAGQTTTGGFIRMCVCIGLQALFMNFTGGMGYWQVYNTMNNLTDVEQLQKKNPYTLAINVDSLTRHTRAATTSPTYPMIYLWPNRSLYVPANAPHAAQVAATAKGCQAFAIVTANSGENPFDLGSPLANLRSLMGTNIVDWALPIRQSPQNLLDSYGPLVNILISRHSITGRTATAHVSEEQV